jgi:hypothetical protein
MKSSQIKRFMKTCIRAKEPLFIWGSPGVGKSDCVQQVSQELGLDLIDIRAALLDPVDLRGVPKVEGKFCVWTTPAFLPQGSGQGILFLDELNAAPPLVQVACYQLVLNRRLGEYTLPDGWIIVAAGNRDTDRAVTTRMSSALKSRFSHVKEFTVDLEDWIAWALGHDVLPEIIAFIRYRPDLLNAFDPARNDCAYPCPRTWAKLSNIIKAGLDADLEFEAICGIVGDGAATEFLGFLRIYRDLPDIDQILAHPTTADVPVEAQVLYALCGALSRKVTDKNAKAAMTYADRLKGEFSVLLVKDIIRLRPELLKTQAFIAWGVAHQDILL